MRIDHVLLEEFAGALLLALGAPKDTAVTVAKSLLGADLCGRHTHGVGLLPLYAAMITDRVIDPLARPGVDTVSAAICRIDGHMAFGQLSGQLAAHSGIEVCRSQGLALVSVRNGTHLGRLGEWAGLACSQGLVFLAFCNTGGGARNVAAFGGRTRKLSTNPVALGVPVFEELPFDIIADFASSQVSGSVIRETRRRGEALQPDWVVDANGDSLRDAQAFLDGMGAILPLGGQNTGHKGYALAVITEVLGGLAGGLVIGQDNSRWFNNAALFIFIDPARLLDRDDYVARIASIATELRGDGVRLPGEGSWSSRQTALREGIILPGHILAALCQLATRHDVDIPAPLAGVDHNETAGLDNITW